MITLKSRPSAVQYADVFDEDSIAKAISYRKAKFDEGVSNVQNTINQLGQLPTLTEEDSQYLSSKINNLTTGINSIAGLDLSNQMNVNKLSAMSNDIADDPIIQNAVSSARNHQKNMKFIEDAKLNPKKYGDIINPVNEAYYSKQLMDYKQARAESKNVVFSSTYKPFKDVSSILSKEIDKMKANGITLPDGSYLRDIESLSPDRIRQLVYGRIQNDSSVNDQLRINSWYMSAGLPDTELIKAKNQIQQTSLLQRKAQADKEVNKLMSLDLKDPQRSVENLNKAKQAVSNYNNIYNTLLTNPNKVLNEETGQEIKNYDKEQMAYDIVTHNLLNEMTSKAYSKEKVRPNPVALHQADMQWQQQKQQIEDTKWQQEFKYKQQQDAIKNQIDMLTSTGRKGKIDADGNITEVSRDVPSVAIDENPKATFDNSLATTKQEARDLLKNTIITKLNKLGDLNQEWLNRYVDTMIDDNQKIKPLAENANMNILKGRLVNIGNKQVPEDAVLRGAVKWINQLGLDVKRVWEGDNIVSKEDSEVYSKYTDAVHKINVLNNIPIKALETALIQNGVSRKEYNDWKNKSLNSTTSTYDAKAGRYVANVGFSGIGSEQKAKLDKIEESINNYYKDKVSTAKLYAVQNFNPSDKDKYFDVKTDVNRFIKAGINNNTIYGKPNKWADKISDIQEFEPKSYNPKTGIVTANIYGLEDGKLKLISTDEQFYVPQEYMQKHLSDEVKKGSQDLTDSDLLNLTENGSISLKDKSGRYKPAWKTTPTELPIQYRAVKTNPKDLTNNEVTAYIKIPINGNETPIELKQTFKNADVVRNNVTELANQMYSSLMPRVKRGEITIPQMKQMILNQISKIND